MATPAASATVIDPPAAGTTPVPVLFAVPLFTVTESVAFPQALAIPLMVTLVTLLAVRTCSTVTPSVSHFATPDFPAPRLVLFAGEVFPIRPLKSLRAAWPLAEMWNLYGPTETNVCTAFPIPATIHEDRDEPYPIGRICPPLSARVIDETGRDVPADIVGELLVSGPGVMRGYFSRHVLTAQAFEVDDLGIRWYRTGDLVEGDGSGLFRFRGRRDRMVKKRGYRIELGEIESALYRHEDVETAAVVAKTGDDGVAISAFVTMKPGRKASIMLEECALAYNTHAINIGKDDQFTPEFIAINPNSKIPAIIDSEGPEGRPLTIFESGAILIYLAEKTGWLLAKSGRARSDALQWLMFQMGGVGPIFGQVHHFLRAAKEPVPYAIERYGKEKDRLYRVLDNRLKEHQYLAGEYSIADMATYPWVARYEWHKTDLTTVPHVKRWFDAISARPAVERGMKVPG